MARSLSTLQTRANILNLSTNYVTLIDQVPGIPVSLKRHSEIWWKWSHVGQQYYTSANSFSGDNRSVAIHPRRCRCICGPQNHIRCRDQARYRRRSTDLITRLFHRLRRVLLLLTRWNPNPFETVSQYQKQNLLWSRWPSIVELKLFVGADELKTMYYLISGHNFSHVPFKGIGQEESLRQTSQVSFL